jgi:hypothetical protein
MVREVNILGELGVDPLVSTSGRDLWPCNEVREAQAVEGKTLVIGTVFYHPSKCKVQFYSSSKAAFQCVSGPPNAIGGIIMLS